MSTRFNDRRHWPKHPWPESRSDKDENVDGFNFIPTHTSGFNWTPAPSNKHKAEQKPLAKLKPTMTVRLQPYNETTTKMTLHEATRKFLFPNGFKKKQCWVDLKIDIHRHALLILPTTEHEGAYEVKHPNGYVYFSGLNQALKLPVNDIPGFTLIPILVNGQLVVLVPDDL